MRVIAGEFAGRKLVAPEGTTTRPTTDKVRLAVFNSLTSMGVIEGAVVADLYAGSGALGIEALSRGAHRCVFVERDRSALGSPPSMLTSEAVGTCGPFTGAAAPCRWEWTFASIAARKRGTEMSPAR